MLSARNIKTLTIPAVLAAMGAGASGALGAVLPTANECLSRTNILVSANPDKLIPMNFFGFLNYPLPARMLDCPSKEVMFAETAVIGVLAVVGVFGAIGSALTARSGLAIDRAATDFDRIVSSYAKNETTYDTKAAAVAAEAIHDRAMALGMELTTRHRFSNEHAMERIQKAVTDSLERQPDIYVQIVLGDAVMKSEPALLPEGMRQFIDRRRSLVLEPAL